MEYASNKKSNFNREVKPDSYAKLKSIFSSNSPKKLTKLLTSFLFCFHSSLCYNKKVIIFHFR